MARLTRHGWVAEAGRTPEQVDEAERRLRRSGPTQSDEERRAAGRVALRVWLPADVHARLERLAEGSSKKATIIRAIEALEKIDSR